MSSGGSPERSRKRNKADKDGQLAPKRVAFKPKRMNAVVRAQGNLLRDPEGTIDPIPFTVIPFTPEQEAWVLHLMRGFNSAVENLSVIRLLYRKMEADLAKTRAELFELRLAKPMHTDEGLRTQYGTLMIENADLKKRIDSLEFYKSVMDMVEKGMEHEPEPQGGNTLTDADGIEWEKCNI